jgi:hypothetical protein
MHLAGRLPYRTSGLEWGKDREVLPITTGETAMSPRYPTSRTTNRRSSPRLPADSRSLRTGEPLASSKVRENPFLAETDTPRHP